MAIGKFEIEHRTKNISDYQIKITKEGNDNCFSFYNKSSQKTEESICIKKLDLIDECDYESGDTLFITKEDWIFICTFIKNRITKNYKSLLL